MKKSIMVKSFIVMLISAMVMFVSTSVFAADVDAELDLTNTNAAPTNSNTNSANSNSNRANRESAIWPPGWPAKTGTSSRAIRSAWPAPSSTATSRRGKEGMCIRSSCWLRVHEFFPLVIHPGHIA